MKQYLPFLQTAVVLAVLLFAGACSLQRYDDCVTVAQFRIDPDGICTDTCTKTFIDLTESNTPYALRWDFGDGAPTSAERNPKHFYSSVDSFIVKLTVIPEDGCPVVEARSYVKVIDGGGPPVVAAFSADPTNCTAECTVTFQNLSQNAESYIWYYGNGDSSLTSLGTHTYTYKRPGAFRAVLLAKRGAKTDRDTQIIEVRPFTFAKTYDWETVLADQVEIGRCVAEAADGGIYLASNSKSIYYAKLNFQGDVQGSVNNITLNSFSDLGIVDAIQSAEGFTMVGTAFSQVLNDYDFYAARLSSQFSFAQIHDNFEPTGDDGREQGYSVARAADGSGFVLAGAKPQGAAKGMLFMKLNPSLTLLQTRVEHTDNANNQALAITTSPAGYAVGGKKHNPASGSFEGCFFQLSTTLISSGSILYLGSFNPKKILRLDDNNYLLIGNEGQTGKCLKIAVSGTTYTASTLYQAANTLFQTGMIDAGNQIVLVGYTSGSVNNGVLFRVNPATGQETFAQTYINNSGNSWQLFSVAQTADNGYLLGGMQIQGTTAQTLLIRTDELGRY